MPYLQRDIVRVRKELPDGTELVHPFLILSCEACNAQEAERFYTGVMITTSEQKDMYTMEITDDMVERPMQKANSQIRLYIIVSFRESIIIGLLSRMKMAYFKVVLENIKNFVLTPDH